MAESGYSSRLSYVTMMTHSAATSVSGFRLRPLSRAWRLSFSIDRSRASLGLRIATRRSAMGSFAEPLIQMG